MLSNDRKQRILTKVAAPLPGAGAGREGAKGVWEGLKRMAGGAGEAGAAGQSWLGKAVSGSGIRTSKANVKGIEGNIANVMSKSGPRATIGKDMDDAAWTAFTKTDKGKEALKNWEAPAVLKTLQDQLKGAKGQVWKERGKTYGTYAGGAAAVGTPAYLMGRSNNKK